ncbi:MAG: hypothetical protein ACREMW_10560 [Gemmatimonadales bacterium]
MNRVILAGLAIVLLRDCEVAGPGPSPGKISGTWGGDNAGLIADDTSAHVHIACTFGNVPQTIVLDRSGRFDVPGVYVLRAYPVYVGPTFPARFQGTVIGSTMTLRVTVRDTTADTTAQLGPVRLVRHREPKMQVCPICRPETRDPALLGS